MSKRRARVARSLLAAAAVVLAGALPSGASARPVASPPPLTLVAQTPWVGATAPWFNLAFAVGELGVPADQLHLNLTFYGRIDDASELQQSMGGNPEGRVLQRVTAPIAGGGGGRSAATCVTIVPDSSVTPPAPTLPAAGGCTAISTTVALDCAPNVGPCDDVYPVAVSLVRQGATSSLARLTTFMTYEEASVITGSEASGTGPLRVGWVVPVSGADPTTLIDDLSDHHQVPVTVAVDPRTVSALQGHGRSGARTLAQLASTTSGDQVLGLPYVPLNLAALESSGLGGEIAAQLSRGLNILRAAGLHPSDSTWVDTASNLTTSSATALATGVGAARADTLVLSDTDLAIPASAEYTLSQPFSLGLPKASHLTTLAADSTLGSRFNVLKADPVLAATQLLAGLSFVHFENAYFADPRGVVLVPPAGWRANPTFVTTLLSGLGTNPALTPVTLDQLVAQVPVGGNKQPPTRRLQSGSASTGGLTRSTVAHITLARQHLASFAGAVAPGHPAVLTTLLDQLLSTEAAGLSTSQRTAALSAYDRQFTRVLSAVSLATEHTVTFTARTAPIPITVLSSAPYPITVVLSVQSDKFTFPGGDDTQTLKLDRPTTPVRVQASARTSGDRLPVEVTLRTPDGQLVIAHTTLTVHSTAISIVGIALTVLALLVLLMWWARTWRRSRQHRPRAH